jgi:hypothetical protein
MNAYWLLFKAKTTIWYNQDRIRAIGTLLVGVGIGYALKTFLTLF